jgi:hypothetical protein
MKNNNFLIISTIHKIQFVISKTYPIFFEKVDRTAEAAQTLI